MTSDLVTYLRALDTAICQRNEARAEVENLYDRMHRLVDGRAKAQLQADRLREQNYELQLKGDEARAEVERLTRERDEARAALKPFASLFLWPDDAGERTANDVRSDEDWDEERNDANVDDVFIKRAHIRAARKALEAKP